MAACRTRQSLSFNPASITVSGTSRPWQAFMAACRTRQSLSFNHASIISSESCFLAFVIALPSS
jgi:hypothetical protein